jgi:hypothetical protein
MNQADLDRNFDHHPPKDEETALAHEQTRAAYKQLAKTMSNLPQGRERALALTKLEESLMWANAAIARPRP